MTGTIGESLKLRPIIQAPRQARPGEKYLMTVDLEPLEPGAWPYQREEYALTVILDTTPLFEHQSIGEPTIVLHRFGGTYGSARFLLRASELEATGDLQITLISETGLPLETMTLSGVQIEKEAVRSNIYSKRSYRHSKTQEESLRPQEFGSVTASSGKDIPTAEPVDLIIKAATLWDGGDRILEYRIHSPSGAVGQLAGQVHRSRPLGAPDAFHTDLLKELERLHFSVGVGKTASVGEVQEALANVGRWLYERLFPKSMWEAYRVFREKARTLLIVSDEPWIPWELVRPFDDRDDDFFCMRFEMGRWLAEAADPVVAKGVRRILSVTTDESDLPSAQTESGILASFAGAEVPVLRNPTCDELKDRLREGVDLLHFAGHGKHRESTVEDADGAWRSELAQIELAERPLRARELVGEISLRLRQDRPVVFFNSCESGRMGWALTGLGGWAQSWIEDCGASAFLAPFLSVEDTAAHDLAESFYRGLRQGQTVGNALRAARHELRNSQRGGDVPKDDLVWLAYGLYAHPNLRVVLGKDVLEAVSVTVPDKLSDSPLKLPELRWRPDRSPPGTLLRAEYGVVPFHFRKTEMEDLEAWCRSGRNLGIRLYTGAGGMGKTRLALELCRRMRVDGWQAGLIDPERSPEETWRALSNIGTPRLLVVDYAETRHPLLVPLFREIYRSEDDVPTRVLLLARTAQDWWEQLKTEGDGVGELLSGPVTRWYILQPLALSPKERATSFRIAIEAFAKFLGKPIPEEIPESILAEIKETEEKIEEIEVERLKGESSGDEESEHKIEIERLEGQLPEDEGLENEEKFEDESLKSEGAELNAEIEKSENELSENISSSELATDLYKRVILLHFIALAVIDDVVVKGEDGILDYVLDRERRFWGRLAEKRGLPVEMSTGIGRAMAAITLGGGVDSEEQAVLAMRGLAYFKDERESMLRVVARLLHEMYPGENKWIEPIMPDLLGEHLIMREMELDSLELLDLVLGPSRQDDEPI